AVYMLYPPVFLIGPIHRYPAFKRQIERRRIQADLIALGGERVLVGLFVTIVLGGYVTREITEFVNTLVVEPEGFFFEWGVSAIGWVDLYFVFGGLSSVAIGCSLIAGLKLEENFNHPYRALNLVEFWSRWHMSLTSWCRDYIYRPITTYTRKPILGVLFAMLVLGLWHETSWFYIGWSIWQATGIILSRLLQPFFEVLPRALNLLLSPFLVLGWLSLANPVMSVLGDIL
ncbi:MAG: MBOAT family O-acyltransferase, partial [Pseudomonadota bacterium]